MTGRSPCTSAKLAGDPQGTLHHMTYEVGAWCATVADAFDWASERDRAQNGAAVALNRCGDRCDARQEFRDFIRPTAITDHAELFSEAIVVSNSRGCVTHQPAGGEVAGHGAVVRKERLPERRSVEWHRPAHLELLQLVVLLDEAHCFERAQNPVHGPLWKVEFVRQIGYPPPARSPRQQAQYGRRAFNRLNSGGHAATTDRPCGAARGQVDLDFRATSASRATLRRGHGRSRPVSVAASPPARRS